jgi:hypothetical protein
MTVESYGDLEVHDDEAFTVASLRDLAMLGRILGVQPRSLLLGPEGEGLQQTVTFGDIAARLAKHGAERGLTLEELGGHIGWDIKDLLLDPEGLWGFNVEGLYEICKAVGLDWVAAVPDALGAPAG